MDKEIISSNNLEFILQQNLSLINIRKKFIFDEHHGWYFKDSKIRSHPIYEQCVLSAYKPLVQQIIEKQPELKLLETKLFNNITKIKYFEKHFCSLFANKIYFDTLSKYIFITSNYGLNKTERKKCIQNFLETSEKIKPFMHQYLLSNIKNQKKDPVVFSIYIDSISSIPLQDDNSINQMFDIVEYYSNKIKSQSTSVKFFKNIIKKFLPSETLKTRIVNIFSPLMFEQDELRMQLTSYLKDTYNLDIHNGQEITHLRQSYNSEIYIDTSVIIKKYNISSVKAEEITVYILYAIKDIVNKAPFALEHKNINSIDTNIFSLLKTPCIQFQTGDFDLFIEMHKYISKIEFILPEIISFCAEKNDKTFSVEQTIELINKKMVFSFLSDKLSKEHEMTIQLKI